MEIDSSSFNHFMFLSFNFSCENILLCFDFDSSNHKRSHYFLASRDECAGSLCHSPTVLVRVWCVNKNFNLGQNFLTRSERAFISHMCIPCDKIFHMVPLFFTSWPWPWSLTYFSKTLTLAITFLPEVIGLSYFTCAWCVFLVIRPFTWYCNIWPHDLDLEVWPTFEKLNLGFYLVMVAARWALLSYDNSY